MTLEQMQQNLSLSKLPACFPALYAQIKDTYEVHGTRILSDAYISETLNACFALAPYRKTVLEAAAQLRQNEAMCLLVCLLEQWVRTSGNLADPDYEAPTGQDIAFDFLHLFPAIPTMPASVSHLRSRGIPEDVIAATMGEYDFCVDMCNTRLGRPAFDFGRLKWISRVIHNQLIRIGRFKYDLPGNYMKGARVYRNGAGETVILADNLQIHRSGRVLGSVGHTDEDGSFLAEITETEDTVTGHRAIEGIVESALTILSKKEWQLYLSEADAMPRIHIPSDGSFDQETVEHSYERAREIFARCYPDRPYKAFFCSSWLMSTDLRKILKPTSNILSFQEPFTLIPWPSSGRLVFSFAFQMDAAIPEDLNTLPENTSLQRAVKQLYLNGGYIHECAGFFF